MASIAVGFVLGLGKYAMYIRKKSSQNKEMMILLEDTLSSLTEVFRNLGNVNPLKISSEIKRRIEILIDKLSRYIHKRLKTSIIKRQFKLQTERVKTKTLMRQLSLLLQEFQIVQLNDLMSRIDENLTKLENLFKVLDEVNEKAVVINDGVKQLIRKLSSNDDLCHSFDKLSGFIEERLEKSGFNQASERNKLIFCIKSYFRTLRMLNDRSLDYSSYFSKLRISKSELEKFFNVNLFDENLKNLFFYQKILPIFDSSESKSIFNLKPYLLALESGYRSSDFSKGDLLLIEGPLTRQNINYSFVSRSNPIGEVNFNSNKNTFELTTTEIGLKIYYLLNTEIKLEPQKEFIIQKSSSYKIFQVTQYEVADFDSDEGTIQVCRKGVENKYEIKDSKLTIIGEDEERVELFSSKEKNTQNCLVNDFIRMEKQDFYLKMRSENSNEDEFTWMKINKNDPILLDTNTVLRIHEKNFQVVFRTS